MKNLHEVQAFNKKVLRAILALETEAKLMGDNAPISAMFHLNVARRGLATTITNTQTLINGDKE